MHILVGPHVYLSILRSKQVSLPDQGYPSLGQLRPGRRSMTYFCTLVKSPTLPVLLLSFINFAIKFLEVHFNSNIIQLYK